MLNWIPSDKNLTCLPMLVKNNLDVDEPEIPLHLPMASVPLTAQV